MAHTGYCWTGVTVAIFIVLPLFAQTYLEAIKIIVSIHLL